MSHAISSRGGGCCAGYADDIGFEIVDYDYEEYDDFGTIRKLVIWICQANENETFRVRPKGNVANKENLYENAAKMVGKPYTVRFLEKSKTGVPIGNPVGECIRWDGDPKNKI